MIWNDFNWDYKGLHIPTSCPICGGDLEILENGEVKCRNPECPQKVSHLIGNFFTVLDIKGAGPAFYDAAAAYRITNTPLYFFLKYVQDVEQCRIWAGGINGDKIQKAILNTLAKPMPTAKYLALFDMEGFGEKRIQSLIDAGYTLDTLYEKATAKDISNIFGWALESSVKFIRALALVKDDVYACLKYVTLLDEKKITLSQGCLAGKSFCFTGAMAYNRKDMEQKVVEHGGIIASVKKGLSYLVQADPTSTSSKSVKAKKLGVDIISPETFLQMIGD